MKPLLISDGFSSLGLCKNVLLLHIRFENISGPTRWKSDENMLSSEMITNGNNISHQKEGKFRTSFLRGKKNTWVKNVKGLNYLY